MAPRRDALIFTLAPRASATPAAAPSLPAVAATEDAKAQQAAQDQVQAQVQAPAQVAAEGQPAPVANRANHARYYSVHRQYGRQPDATPLPPPVYLDALPVDVSGMTSATDLAEPPAPPTLIRNNNGRLQAMPNLDEPGA